MQFGPSARPGQRIGLLGGSFDPPHEGHVHITRWALRRFRLDQVWWLVSPGNPLKARGPAALERRVSACDELLSRSGLPDRRVSVTDIEAHLGTRYTADTLAALKRGYGAAKFTWLMGADNLLQFHEWDRWRWIMETFPVGVLGRPGAMAKARFAPAARRYRRYRVPKGEAARLPMMRAPAWAMLTSGPLSSASSTAIRKAGEWP